MELLSWKLTENSKEFGRHLWLEPTLQDSLAISLGSFLWLALLMDGAELANGCWTPRGRSNYARPLAVKCLAGCWSPTTRATTRAHGIALCASSSWTGRASDAQPPKSNSALKIETTGRTKIERAQAQARRAKTRQLRYATLGSRGFLRKQAVKPKTQQLYAKVVHKFYQSRALTDQDAIEILDRYLEKDLTKYYLAGDAISKARYLFYAIRWHKGIPNVMLPRSFAALQGYTKSTNDVAGDPNSWEAVVLTAAAGCRIGKPSNILAAAATIAQFDTMTRPGEILKVKRAWLLAHSVNGVRQALLTVFPSDQAELEIDEDAVICDKTGRQDDTMVVGTVAGKWIGKMLLDLKRAGFSDTLFPLTLPKYERAFYENTQAANLGRLNMVLHGNRHGGASLYANQGGQPMEVQSRGRWASTRSVLRYQKQGRYVRIRAKLHPMELNQAKKDEIFLQNNLAALARKAQRDF